MLKILVLNTLYPPTVVGGAELSVQTLVENLRRKGFDTRVISTHPEKNKSSFTKINGELVFKHMNIYWPFDGKKHGCKMLFWHIIDSYNLLGYWRVRKCIKIFEPDVFITNNLQGFSALAWLAAYHKNTPVIHILRDYGLISADPSITKAKDNKLVKVFNFMIRWHYQKLAQNLTYITGISNFVLEKHLEKIQISKTKSKTIHNGIEFDGFIDNTRKSTNVIRIGYLGRLSEEKGIAWLLEKMDLLDLSFSYNITVAGTGPLEEKLSKQYGNHKFLGKTNPKIFFNQIDLLIVPSQWDEPFGRIIIEAYCFGIPVVFARRGGIPELIYPKHQNIMGYNDSDINGLQKALNCFHDIRGDLEKEDLISYSKNFSPNKCVEQYIDLINRCVNSHVGNIR